MRSLAIVVLGAVLLAQPTADHVVITRLRPFNSSVVRKRIQMFT